MHWLTILSQFWWRKSKHLGLFINWTSFDRNVTESRESTPVYCTCNNEIQWLMDLYPIYPNLWPLKQLNVKNYKRSSSLIQCFGVILYVQSRIFVKNI
jgi:hypothetical protein